jgi:LPXTG-motif cell wall-anchored protein
MKIKGLKRRQTLFISILLVALLAVGNVVTLFAASVTPNPLDGNDPTFEGCTKVKLDTGSIGEYTLLNGKIKVEIYSDNNGQTAVNWESEIPISKVYVKGGPNGNLYTYDPAKISDTELYPPVNPNNKHGKTYGVSHVTFYICDQPEITSLIIQKTIINSNNQSLDENSYYNNVKFEVTVNGYVYNLSVNEPLYFTDISPDDYTISETGLPNGYELASISDNVVGGSISLKRGEKKTVIITNKFTGTTPDPVTLYVYKSIVVGEGENETTITDSTIQFPIIITGPDYYNDDNSVSVNTPWVEYTLNPGKYTVAEDIDNIPPGYTFLSISDNGQVTLEPGQTGYIYITNRFTDTEGSYLKVNKVVVGTPPSNAEYYEAQVLYGEVVVYEFKYSEETHLLPGNFRTVPFEPGTYTIQETLTHGASVSYSESSFSVPENGTKEITITNTFQTQTFTSSSTGTLIVNKVVENGGSADQMFPITVRNSAGSIVATGQVSVNTPAFFNNLNPGTYTVTEDTPLPDNYTLVSINPASVFVPGNGTGTITITNRFEDEEEIEIELELPAVQNEEEIEIEPELPAVQNEEEIEIELEPELPKTGGADILLLGLGTVIAGGGLLIRRKRK